jgi:hypothetical protein
MQTIFLDMRELILCTRKTKTKPIGTVDVFSMKNNLSFIIFLPQNNKCLAFFLGIRD